MTDKDCANARAISCTAGISKKKAPQTQGFSVAAWAARSIYEQTLTLFVFARGNVKGLCGNTDSPTFANVVNTK